MIFVDFATIGCKGIKGGTSMVEVCVCVGSSCHMKGSYQVIKTFQELIKKLSLEDKITLKAAFCMGRCVNGIAVSVDGEPIDHVGFINAEQVFYDQIYPKVR